MGHVPLLDELAIVIALAVAVTVVLSKLKLPTVAGLLAPAVVLLVRFFAIPSIDLFRLSLAHMDAQRAIHHDVSLGNYKNFATNPYFHRMVWGSVKLTVAVLLTSPWPSLAV